MDSPFNESIKRSTDLISETSKKIAKKEAKNTLILIVICIVVIFNSFMIVTDKLSKVYEDKLEIKNYENNQ